MANKNEKEVLEVGVDIQAALADMAKMQRATTRNFQEIAKAVDKLNATNRRASDDAADGAEKWEAGIADLTKAYKEEGKEIENLLETVELLQKKANAAAGDEKANLEEQIKALKRVGAERIKALRSKEGKEGRAAAEKLFKDSRGELKNALKDTIHSVFSRDLKGIVENSAKTLVKGLKLSAASGLKLGGMGGNLMERGKARGGMGGMGMQAGGAALKGMGTLMGGIKPLIQGLSKIGPILGVVSGALLGIAKLFLDLDAKAKDFNRDILQSASNVEFLAQAGGSSALAFSQLEDTLHDIRNAAYDLKNINMGISPDEFKGVFNVLNQEGVSLRSINTEAARAGQTVKDFSSELAHVSIAYSRAFGVPLQEINQLQAEMMTEMGIDLKQTKVAFQGMTQAATDSGIAANKFFSMIRGVSQDLSIWGTRMEDAVKLLGRLGQVMNPRNAQKFMQTAVQGLKNMGRTERLRLTLLTGQGKMSKLIERDTQRKAAGLAKTLGMTTEDLISRMKTEGPAGLESAIQDLPKEMQGATREALIDMQLQQKRAGKGTFGTATAARNLGATGALQSMTDALKQFVPGAKSLADIAGTIGGEMMAENLGISEEQLDQMIKFEAALDNQRDVLRKQLASGNEAQMEAARQALKQAGITATTDEELRKQIDAAGYDQIMDTLSEGDKKALEESSKIEDFARKQADLQTSILKKIEMILDWLMNQIYNILLGIWDMIGSIPGIGKSYEQRSLEKAVFQSKDPDALRRLEESGGDTQKFRDKTIMSGGVGKALTTALENFKNAKTDNEKTIAGAELKRFLITINGAFKGNKDGVKGLLGSIGVGGTDIDKVLAEMAKGVDFSKAMVNAGLSADMQSKAIEKSLWHMDAASVARLGGPGVSGGSGVAAPVSIPRTSESPSVKETAAIAEDNLSLTKEQLDTMKSVDNQMDRLKMDTGFLNGAYSKAMEGSVLGAVRTALFEYFMYKDLSPTDVAATLSETGLTGRSFSQRIGEAANQGYDAEIALGALKPNAAGGLVTGTQGGLAMVTAAAGEGLASVGPGERIVPQGGGGNLLMQINVQGVGGRDLARIIEAKVADGVYEYKRKERFR